MVRSKKKMAPVKLLDQFANMCRESRAPDGDWQGDGWGIAVQDQKWEVYTSLRPIWDDRQKFSKLPEATTFVVHARSAGFPQHKGIREYNQPYVRDGLAFVFNGMIRGVTLPMKLEGSIGAQKIFSLIADRIRDQDADGVLPYVRDVIRENARRVEGMNIGLIVGERLHALCDYEHNADYFGLRYHKNDELAMICSAPIGAYEWQVMRKGEILAL